MQNTKNWNIADNTICKYTSACLQAGTNEESFNNFKRNHDYTAVLEHQHLAKEYGDLMLSSIESKYAKDHLLNKINKIKENDKYGNPILYDFKNYGHVSLGTLKYVKNSCDIIFYFNEKKSKQ